MYKAVGNEIIKKMLDQFGSINAMSGRRITPIDHKFSKRQTETVLYVPPVISVTGNICFNHLDELTNVNEFLTYNLTSGIHLCTTYSSYVSE